MATISNNVDNTIISGTNEADSIGNGNSNVTIYGYEGNDTIYSIGRIVYSGGVRTEVARDSVSIDSGIGEDYIRYSGGNYLSINAGDDNDTLSLDNNNYIYVDLGNGNDQLDSFSGNNVTVMAGSGNDKIDFSGNNVIINAGSDDDEIVNYDENLTSYYVKTDPANISYGSNITINAGTGNDTLLVGNNDVVSYIEGDGDDVIYGYYVGDTIKIDSTNTPSTVASGSDIIINVGSGSIRLVNVTDTAITAINSSGDIIDFSEGVPNTTDSNVASGWATITSNENSNIVSDDNNFANGTENADTIQASSISNTVRAVYSYGGDDVISVEGSPNGIEFSNVTLEGGAGNDFISIYGNIDGIHPSTVSIGSGDGNDTINIYGSNEGIHGGISEAIEDKTSATIDGSEGDDTIIIQGANDKGIDISKVTITGGAGNDLISIYGGNYGIGSHEGAGGSTVSIDGGDDADSIYISAIDSLSGVSIVAGSGDNISVGSGGANYLFDSTDKVTINGATFTANSANTSASLFSSADTTSIKSAWNGTIALSGTNSLADIDGSIVSAAGNYQIVDGRLARTIEPAPTPVINPDGKNYDIIFIIDISGSMDDYIDDVKANVKNFATSLRNSGVGNIRFGLISYETEPTAQTFSNEGNVYLTSDVDEFKTAVDNLSTYGGTEYGLTALETAMSIVSDEDDTTKRFIVVTDEDCDDSSMFNATNIDNTLKSRGIVMDVVGSEGSCRTEWEPLANGTNGKFYLLGSGFPSIFNKITTDIINIVDLNLVPENQTGYFVATQNSDTYTTPIFQTNGASVNDTTVGSVTESNFYVADSDTDRQQTIILTNGWNVTATKNDDKLLINGESATVTGGDGEDVFSLGSDTKSVTLLDLNIYDDKISFGNYIMPGTMRQSIEDNHLVLSADDLRVDIPTMSEMTEEFLDYNVSNAGNTATIRELINGDGKAIISFAHWSFTFNQTAFEQFGF